MIPDPREASAWADLWLHTRILLRVGRREIDIDKVADLARALGPATLPLTVLTAYNPQGEPHERAWNEDANAVLRGRLREMGLIILPATGRAAAGDWEEPGFAVSGISQAAARALARQFGQLALFWVEEDQVSALASDGDGAWSRPRGSLAE